MNKKLAIWGGSPVVPKNTKIYQEPIMTKEDKKAAIEVIRSGKYFGDPGAPQTSALQVEWANYVGVRYCIALNSGTAALHAALAAADVGPGDEVITSPVSFITSATSSMYQNAIPVFCDIDPRTYNINPEKIEQKITNRTKAIVPVHLCGLPADMDEINRIAQKHNLIVVEDACQAHGATYKGKKVGSLGHMGAFSLQRSKNFTTGADGGLLTTNRQEFAVKAEMVGRFGEIIKKGLKRNYNSFTMGWMYRTNEILSAIARSRLKRLDQENKVRQRNCEYLSKELSQIKGVIPPYVPQDRTHVYYLYAIRFAPKELGLKIPSRKFREKAEAALRSEGVPIGQWQIMPIYDSNLFKLKKGYGKGCPWSCRYANEVEYRDEDYPETIKFFEECTALWFFQYPNSLKFMKFLVEAFRKVFDNIDQLIKRD